MPVFRTAMRVPGGDAVQHVYGAGDLAVVEITNDSPAPFVVALVVHGAARLGLEDRVIGVDGRPAVITARGPSRWAAELDGTTEQVVMSGQAHEGPFRPRHESRGAAHRRVPVPGRAPHHVPGRGRARAEWLARRRPRSRCRFVAGARRRGAGMARAARPCAASRASRSRAAATRSTPRAPTCCSPGQAWMPDPMVVAALEDWGFDDEVRGGVAAAAGSGPPPARQAHAADRRLGRRRRGRRRSVAHRCCWVCARHWSQSRTPRSRCSPALAGRRGVGSRSTCGTRRRARSRVVLGALAR